MGQPTAQTTAQTPNNLNVGAPKLQHFAVTFVPCTVFARVRVRVRGNSGEKTGPKVE